jgi:hypothetical protein
MSSEIGNLVTPQCRRSSSGDRVGGERRGLLLGGGSVVRVGGMGVERRIFRILGGSGGPDGGVGLGHTFVVFVFLRVATSHNLG